MLIWERNEKLGRARYITVKQTLKLDMPVTEPLGVPWPVSSFCPAPRASGAKLLSAQDWPVRGPEMGISPTGQLLTLEVTGSATFVPSDYLPPRVTQRRREDWEASQK